MYTFDEHDFLLSHCPALNYYIIPQSLVVSKWNRSIKELIVDSIDSNNYLFLFIDRYYLTNSDCYMKRHFPHQIFVFGYDLKKNTVSIADNLQFGKFIKTECTFDEFENAYWNVSGDYTFLTDVRFIELKNVDNIECNCSLDIEQILIGFDNYLNSKRVIKVLNEQKFDYGFNSLDILLNELNSLNLNTYNHIDTRAFHLFYEHKLLMEMRVKYMVENGFLIDKSNLVNDFTILKDNYYKLRNKAVKYNVKNDINLLKNIRGNLEQNIIIEKNLIDKLIQSIR